MLSIPYLIVKAGGEVRNVLAALASLNMGQLFSQLVSPTLDGMLEEMELAANIRGAGLVLKVPPTENGFKFVS